MLETLQNFFSFVEDFFNQVASFLNNLISGFINIFKSVPLAINMLSSSILHLPSTLLVFATLTITISVVYLVVGRDTGG